MSEIMTESPYMMLNLTNRCIKQGLWKRFNIEIPFNPSLSHSFPPQQAMQLISKKLQSMLQRVAKLQVKEVNSSLRDKKVSKDLMMMQSLAGLSTKTHKKSSRKKTNNKTNTPLKLEENKKKEVKSIEKVKKNPILSCFEALDASVISIEGTPSLPDTSCNTSPIDDQEVLRSGNLTGYDMFDSIDHDSHLSFELIHEDEFQEILRRNSISEGFQMLPHLSLQMFANNSNSNNNNNNTTTINTTNTSTTTTNSVANHPKRDRERQRRCIMALQIVNQQMMWLPPFSQSTIFQLHHDFITFPSTTQTFFTLDMKFDYYRTHFPRDLLQWEMLESLPIMDVLRRDEVDFDVELASSMGTTAGDEVNPGSNYQRSSSDVIFLQSSLLMKRFLNLQSMVEMNIHNPNEKMNVLDHLSRHSLLDLLLLEHLILKVCDFFVMKLQEYQTMMKLEVDQSIQYRQGMLCYHLSNIDIRSQYWHYLHGIVVMLLKWAGLMKEFTDKHFLLMLQYHDEDLYNQIMIGRAPTTSSHKTSSASSAFANAMHAAGNSNNATNIQYYITCSILRDLYSTESIVIYRTILCSLPEIMDLIYLKQGHMMMKWKKLNSIVDKAVTLMVALDVKFQPSVLFSSQLVDSQAVNASTTADNDINTQQQSPSKQPSTPGMSKADVGSSNTTATTVWIRCPTITNTNITPSQLPSQYECIFEQIISCLNWHFAHTNVILHAASHHKVGEKGENNPSLNGDVCSFYINMFGEQVYHMFQSFPTTSASCMFKASAINSTTWFRRYHWLKKAIHTFHQAAYALIPSVRQRYRHNYLYHLQQQGMYFAVEKSNIATTNAIVDEEKDVFEVEGIFCMIQGMLYIQEYEQDAQQYPALLPTLLLPPNPSNCSNGGLSVSSMMHNQDHQKQSTTLTTMTANVSNPKPFIVRRDLMHFIHYMQQQRRGHKLIVFPNDSQHCNKRYHRMVASFRACVHVKYSQLTAATSKTTTTSTAPHPHLIETSAVLHLRLAYLHCRLFLPINLDIANQNIAKIVRHYQIQASDAYVDMIAILSSLSTSPLVSSEHLHFLSLPLYHNSRPAFALDQVRFAPSLCSKTTESVSIGDEVKIWKYYLLQQLVLACEIVYARHVSMTTALRPRDWKEFHHQLQEQENSTSSAGMATTSATAAAAAAAAAASNKSPNNASNEMDNAQGQDKGKDEDDDHQSILATTYWYNHSYSPMQLIQKVVMMKSSNGGGGGNGGNSNTMMSFAEMLLFYCFLIYRGLHYLQRMEDAHIDMMMKDYAMMSGNHIIIFMQEVCKVILHCREEYMLNGKFQSHHYFLITSYHNILGDAINALIACKFETTNAAAGNNGTGKTNSTTNTANTNPNTMVMKLDEKKLDFYLRKFELGLIHYDILLEYYNPLILSQMASNDLFQATCQYYSIAIESSHKIMNHALDSVTSRCECCHNLSIDVLPFAFQHARNELIVILLAEEHKRTCTLSVVQAIQANQASKSAPSNAMVPSTHDQGKKSNFATISNQATMKLIPFDEFLQCIQFSIFESKRYANQSFLHAKHQLLDFAQLGLDCSRCYELLASISILTKSQASLQSTLQIRYAKMYLLRCIQVNKTLVDTLAPPVYDDDEDDDNEVDMQGNPKPPKRAKKKRSNPPPPASTKSNEELKAQKMSILLQILVNPIYLFAAEACLAWAKTSPIMITTSNTANIESAKAGKALGTSISSLNTGLNSNNTKSNEETDFTSFLVVIDVAIETVKVRLGYHQQRVLTQANEEVGNNNGSPKKIGDGAASSTSAEASTEGKSGAEQPANQPSPSSTGNKYIDYLTECTSIIGEASLKYAELIFKKNVPNPQQTAGTFKLTNVRHHDSISNTMTSIQKRSGGQFHVEAPEYAQSLFYYKDCINQAQASLENLHALKKKYKSKVHEKMMATTWNITQCRYSCHIAEFLSAPFMSIIPNVDEMVTEWKNMQGVDSNAASDASTTTTTTTPPNFLLNYRLFFTTILNICKKHATLAKQRMEIIQLSSSTKFYHLLFYEYHANICSYLYQLIIYGRELEAYKLHYFTTSSFTCNPMALMNRKIFPLEKLKYLIAVRLLLDYDLEAKASWQYEDIMLEYENILKEVKEILA